MYCYLVSIVLLHQAMVDPVWLGASLDSEYLYMIILIKTSSGLAV